MRREKFWKLISFAVFAFCLMAFMPGRDVNAAESTKIYDAYMQNDGSIQIAVGGKLKYDIVAQENLSGKTFYYGDDLYTINVDDVTYNCRGNGSATYDGKVLTGMKEGTVTVDCKFTCEPEDSSLEKLYKVYSFDVNVVNYSMSGKTFYEEQDGERYNRATGKKEPYYHKDTYIKIDGWNDDTVIYGEEMSSNFSAYYNEYYGWYECYLYGLGTRTLKTCVDGRTFTVKITLNGLRYKGLTGLNALTRGITTYKDQKTTVYVEVKSKGESWKKASGVKYSSTNSKVASVNSKGVVTGKKNGNAKIKMKFKGTTITIPVGVTYKKAYQACQNAYKDYQNKKIKYSQPKRMAQNFRDCSSFVSRCYYDTTLNRKLLKIGGGKGNDALTAADQASWLNSHKKCIKKSSKNFSIDTKKLLPGDTLYSYTGYAGTNSRYLHIDHAAIYVGNGCVMEAGGVALAFDRWMDDNLRFVGRPLK